jgi:hypothetical protein
MQFKARLSDKFRAAIATGDLGDAERALDELRHEVEESWHAAASASEQQAIASEITGLLEWARQALLVKRAHAQSKLSRLSRQGAYVGTGSRRLAMVEFEG